MASHHYPSHPPTGGKGLPPPSNFSQPQPQLSSSVGSSQYATSHSHIQGQPPDLEKRFKLKVRYLKIQKKYFRSLEERKDLELELAEKEAKQQKLQDEIDLILDQIHQSDYAHLRPKDDNIFSDDEGENENGTSGIKRERGLDDEERERRKELEEEFGVDSNQATVVSSPLSRPMKLETNLHSLRQNPSAFARSSTRAQPHSEAPTQRIPEATPSTSTNDQIQPPNPKRIKLTFGSGAPNISVQ
ncbi:uncharacterized protein JCM6883_006752 [Sporobolomyces salmoneus]|uniref:uncharacterized protein n=1 Tax=Sporobolomyces salmoneus TaxID=183962 RepID=UPI0031824962